MFIGFCVESTSDDATKYYKSALDIKKSHGANNTCIITTFNKLVTAYSPQGLLGMVINCYQKIAEIQIKSLGEDHPELATTYYRLGSVYMEQGEHNSVLSLFENVVRIKTEHGKFQPHWVLEICVCLFWVSHSIRWPLFFRNVFLL